MNPRFLTFFVAAVVLALSTTLAASKVQVGKNVRVGGHEVVPQTFTKERNGIFYIYENNPKNPGCRWRKNADGTRTKLCHLKRKK